MAQQVFPLPAVDGLIAFRFQSQFIPARRLDDTLSLPQVQKQSDIILHKKV